MTERLYYHDSYITAFVARIVERTQEGDNPAVVLDRTYFYPAGGGQPPDHGMLAGARVIDVQIRESDHAILHVLDAPVVGDQADCQVDWPRRFDHMQQHTGQHILTQAFVEVVGANTTSFHLGSTVTIDLDQALPDALATERVEELANHIVITNRPVTERVVSEAEARQLGTRIRRIPGHLATDGLRVIEIQDFDLTACGGTHVARTGEIGLIKIIRVERHREGSRVEFCCGGRALADYRFKNALVGKLASAFTTGPEEVPGAIERLQADLKAAQSDLKRARAALTELEIPALLASAENRGSIRLISRVYADRPAEDVRGLASRLIQQPGLIVLLAAAGDRAQVFAARSADVDLDMNMPLRAALAALGAGRGGGRPDFAQGGGIGATQAALEEALRLAAGTLPPAGVEARG